MQRLLLSLLFTALLGTCVRAQIAFNTTLRDNLTYPPGVELNDVWAYVAPDGTEYALVGRTDGLSIVSLADPDDIEEVAFVAGDNSIWRDIKTFGEFTYVVADQGNDGIVAIDLSNLPASVSSQQFNSDNTAAGDLTRAHNIYVDEPTGLAYIAGANVNSGGMVIYDLATSPGTPTFVAFAPNVYAHDVYVQDGVMYASEINGGELTLYDVSDPQNITEMASTPTPFTFTHNAWTDATGNYVYTTDERGNAPVAAYDISDPNDIQLLDEFRPSRSLNTGTIPHNAHVLDDYLVVSYYTDGVEIVDASVPDNLVEVAYYDHWSGSNGGFNGSWGAYPFLPSGLVLSTDISNGLYVVEVDYKRAARLRGVVTDFDSGATLNNVEVTISSSNPTTTRSRATGRYKTGIAEAGTFTVTYSLAGYNPLSFPLDFVNGVETIQDTFLVIKSTISVTGDVTSTADGGAVAGAEVRLESEDGTAEDVSDNNGNVSFPSLFTGNYRAYAGVWGFNDQEKTVDLLTSGNNVSFQIAPGFRDGFAVDQGWTVSGNAATGGWERGVPVGTTFGGAFSNPGEDASGDVGDQAFVTGNGGGSAGNDDVDGGTTTLSSPVFDPADVEGNDVMVRYQYWWLNGGGDGLPDDEMTVVVFNGSEREVVRTYTNATAVSSAWTADNFDLSELSIAITSTMQIEVTIGDTGGGHLVEGGFDDFELIGLATLPVVLTSFSAAAIAKQTALVSWSTAEEFNNSHFVVERRNDRGVFSTIGRVEAEGSATAYNLTDADAETGDNYYRLRMVDRDGSFELSETRLVSFAGSEELLVYPNPTSGLLYFSEPVEGPVRVYGMDGRLLQTTATDDRIDMREYPSGSYVVVYGGRRVVINRQ